MKIITYTSPWLAELTALRAKVGGTITKIHTPGGLMYALKVTR